MENQRTPLIMLGLGGIAIAFLVFMLFVKSPASSSEATPTPDLQTGQPTSETLPAQDIPTEGADSTSETSEPSGEVRTIEIEAGSFYYKPETLTIKKGEKIKLVFKSVDMMHDFVIDELGIKVPVTKGGETATFEFSVDTVGTFEYYCSVGQHRKMGQVGTLTVTE